MASDADGTALTARIVTSCKRTALTVQKPPGHGEQPSCFPQSAQKSNKKQTSRWLFRIAQRQQGGAPIKPVQNRLGELLFAPSKPCPGSCPKSAGRQRSMHRGISGAPPSLCAPNPIHYGALRRMRASSSTLRSRSKSATTRWRACSPRRRLLSGSSSNSSMARAKSSTSPGGTSRP